MRLGFVALTLAGLALTGCEEEGGSAAAGGLPGKTPVVGTETCQRAVDSDEVLDDGTEVMVETFTCDTVMSDPRGSGREVLHIETTLLEEDDVTSAWTGEGTITNDDGSWSGPVEGVVGYAVGVVNYGQVTYAGQGAYAGLTMHLLVAGTNERLAYAGWIEGPDEGGTGQVLDGRIPVIGTDNCERSLDSDERLDDGTEVMLETFDCDLETSDPRATGHEIWHTDTRFLEPDDATSAATGEGTLRNDEGSWAAMGDFIVEFAGGSPTNYGEQSYIGQGAYEGLTMDILIAGSNERLSWAGWIEGLQ